MDDDRRVTLVLTVDEATALTVALVVAAAHATRDSAEFDRLADKVRRARRHRTTHGRLRLR